MTLEKQPTEFEDLKMGIRKDGKKYSIRTDRHRFFNPDEWTLFIKTKMKEKSKQLNDFMFNTGSRFDEATHIRPKDFDFERGNVRLWKTKTKSAKGETIGKPRTISLSTSYSKRVKKYCNKFNPDDFIFKMSLPGFNKLLKSKLQKLGIVDWYNFSSHNIRKTHGMYLKALGIDIGEICTRLSHDYNTYITHYGSADVFTDKDMRRIKELLDDLYMRQRRF